MCIAAIDPDPAAACDAAPWPEAATEPASAGWLDVKPLAICAVFKNEAPFLLEWIAYHRVIGFDHFVLYDNDSTDGGAALIRSSWAADCATVIHWPRRPAQLPAYRHFIYNESHAFSWAAFIDLDEFLVPLQDATMRDVLAAYQAYSAVLVHWRVFGPSGWDAPPAGLIIDSYDMRAPDAMPVNGHIKSIARCADLLDVTANPHEFQLKGPVCDTLGRLVPNVAIQPAMCHAKLVIHHYVTRSRQDWMAKIRRGSAAIENRDLKYREDLFDHYKEISTVRDGTIRRYLPQVRTQLARPTTAVPGAATDPIQPGLPSVVAHIQYAGDVDADNGAWIGMRRGGRWIEGIAVIPGRDITAEGIEYRVVLGREVVSPWVPGGMFCGSRGLGVPIRGFAIRLLGRAAAQFECFYTATFTDGSEYTPAQPDGVCAAETLAPLEALRLVVQAR